MNQMIYINSDLPEMDAQEVSYVSGLVTSLWGEFHPSVIVERVCFFERRSPFTAYLDPDDPYSVTVCLPQHQADNPLARLVGLSARFAD